MSEQKPTERKPLVRIVKANELKGGSLCARDYVFEKLGEAPVTTKEELKGFGPGGENW